MLVLVNLPSAHERRRHMAAQLDALDLTFDRVGFDGRLRSPAAIAAWCCDRFGDIAFDFERLSGAEVGCWLSHLSAWQLLRDRRERACTVIEDDVALAPDFGTMTAMLERESPYDVVYLGTSSRNISAKHRVCVAGCWLHEPVGAVYNTWGYVVTHAYVEGFLALRPMTLRVPIDHFLGGTVRRGHPRLAVLRPAVVTEEPALAARSQIEPHTFRFDRWKIVEETRRKLLCGRAGALYSALYRWL